MKTRLKSKTSEPLTRDQVELLVNDIALLKNNERLITADMDEKLNAVRARYTAPLEQITADLKNKTAQLQHWAETHPAEFAKKKSLDFPSGKIGFSTGTPKLKLLAKWTWDAVLDAIENVFHSDDVDRYIRTRREVDKEALIRTATTPEFATHTLKTIGLKLVQDESFYVEPNLTELQTRETVTSPAENANAA